MFSASTATNLVHSTHHHPHHLNHSHHTTPSNQPSHLHQNHVQTHHHLTGSHFANHSSCSVNHHQQGHTPSQQQPPSSTMPQFLETTNQHLMAFNQHSAALANSHFVDSINATDANQFVSVIQQNHPLQGVDSFNPVSLFHSAHSNNTIQHSTHQSQPNNIRQSMTQHSRSTSLNASHHSLSSANIISTNNVSANAAGLSAIKLAGASHVIVNQHCEGPLRLPIGTGVVTNLANSALGNNNNNDNNNNNTNNNNTIAINTGNSKRSSNKSKSSNSGSTGGGKKEKSDSPSNKNSESPRRTFACPTCGKGFTEKFNMKRHMQIHSQSRPKHICDECSKSFAWKDNYIRHKKAAHGNNLQQFQV